MLNILMMMDNHQLSNNVKNDLYNSPRELGRVIDPETGPFISQDEDKIETLLSSSLENAEVEKRERSLVAGKQT